LELEPMLALDSWTKRQLVQCQFKRVVQQFMRQRDVERLAVSCAQ
jgi:hypothetical protein